MYPTSIVDDIIPTLNIASLAAQVDVLALDGVTAECHQCCNDLTWLLQMDFLLFDTQGTNVITRTVLLDPPRYNLNKRWWDEKTAALAKARCFHGEPTKSKPCREIITEGCTVVLECEKSQVDFWISLPRAWGLSNYRWSNLNSSWSHRYQKPIKLF